MERVNVYLGLGTNEGERELNLLRAMNALDEAFGMHPERISRIVETPAWGFDGPDFLNLCVMYRLPAKGSAEEHAQWILSVVKEIEKAMGRSLEPLFDADGQRLYHNRIIDIDILLYGTETVHTENITIPHPLISQRDFVKIPLKEISKPDVRTAFPEIFSAT